MEEDEKPLTTTLSKLKKWFPTLEIILGLLSLIALLLSYFNVNGWALIATFTFLPLSSLFFLSAYIPTNHKHIFGLISTKVVGISASICTVGILFKVLKMEGSEVMLTVGSISLLAGTLLMSVIWLRSNEKEYVPIIIRSVLVLLMTVMLADF
jgi:hypothetical protein